MRKLSRTPGNGQRLPAMLSGRRRWAALAVALVLSLATGVLVAGARSVRAVVHCRIVATVPVGSDPTGEAYSPNGRFLYVTNLASRTVSVINTANDKVAATIRVGRDPTGVAVSPDGKRAYVVDGLSDGEVTVIDTGRNKVIDTIRLGPDSYPQEVAVSPNGRLVYATNWAPGTVSVIDTRTGKVTGTVHVAAHPIGVTFATPNRAFVASLGPTEQHGAPGAVTEIDTAGHRIKKVVGLGIASGPWGVAAGPGNKLFVTDSGSNTVSVINTANDKVTGKIKVGTGPYGVAVSTKSRRAYVTNPVSQSMSVINTNSDKVVTTVRGLHYPTSTAVNPAGTRVYVADQKPKGAVTVVSMAPRQCR